MKKILLPFYVLAVVLSMVSCKENTNETTLEADETFDTPAEVNETPAVEEVDIIEEDSTSIQ